jgi:hypothetical protein
VAVTRTLSVGIAAGLMRFDTNFRFENPETGRSIFVDAESSLGLPESKVIPLIYGYWRPSERHGLGFGYFSIRRESEILAIDRNFGDLSVNGLARLADDTRFYSLTYNYTLFHDSRAFLFASLGLNVIDLEYRLDAEGEIRLGGELIDSGNFTRPVQQTAPLPMFGLDAWFVITDKWSFGARAAFIAGEVSDIRALVSEARIRVKYSASRNAGLFFGLSYFDGDIKIRKDDLVTDIGYGFDGLILGIDVGF